MQAFDPLFGVASGRFLGWWSEHDAVWRDETGRPIGYVEAAYGPWSEDEDGNPLDWESEPQSYALYRFEEGRVGQVGTPWGEVLSSLPPYGPEWAGRFKNSWSGPGRRAVPAAEHLVAKTVPPRPPDREGISQLPGSLVDPEDNAWRPA